MKKRIIVLLFLLLQVGVYAQGCDNDWFLSLLEQVQQEPMKSLKDNSDALAAYEFFYRNGKIADEVTEEVLDGIKKLGNDFNRTDQAYYNAFNNNPELLDIWKYVSDLKVSGKSKLPQDIELLEVIQRQWKNGIVEKIGSKRYDDIIKNYAGKCKVCDTKKNVNETVKHLPPHDEMLSNLETFINTHTMNKPGVSKVISDLKSTPKNKKEQSLFLGF